MHFVRVRTQGLDKAGRDMSGSASQKWEIDAVFRVLDHDTVEFSPVACETHPILWFQYALLIQNVSRGKCGCLLYTSDAADEE